MNKKIIDVSGIGHSGKTIVNEIFTHHSKIHVHSPLFEFNLLRVYGGLINLHSNLVENWSPNRADIAINQFKHLIKTISPTAKMWSINSLINSNGWNYNEMLECDFEQISKDYINSLISLESKSVWPYPEIYKNSLIRFFRRVAGRIFNYQHKNKVIFSDATNFNNKTKLFLEDILFNHNKNLVCTNNMFEPYNEGKYFKFFNDPYQINVWRDPRDIYVSTKLGDVFSPNFESSQSIGSYHKSFTLSDDINNFITREKILISKCNFKDSNRILNIKFEDIIHNFEQSVDRISNFVGISFKNVNYIKEKINVENSKKNIGVWKAYDNQLEIDLISKELNDYMSYFKYE